MKTFDLLGCVTCGMNHNTLFVGMALGVIFAIGLAMTTFKLESK